MPSPWNWDDVSRRYRDTSTGRYIGSRQMLTLRNGYIEAKKAEVDRLARKLANGDIDIQRWTLDMRSSIKDAFIDEYCLAFGGRNNMTQANWGQLGHMLRDQYGYLQRFAGDIQAGKMSEGQIKVRSEMYIDAATQAYERGHSEGLGLPRLPAYPGDGQTQCRANCQCAWDIQDSGNQWDCTWKLGVAEHCPDCVDNSQRWAPLVVGKV